MGAGKYDDLATACRVVSGARAVLVIIMEGKDGSGFSVQMEEGMLVPLPKLLREVADSIEKEMGNDQNKRQPTG